MRVFVHVHEVEAAGRKTLVAYQLLTYRPRPPWPYQGGQSLLLTPRPAIEAPRERAQAERVSAWAC
jgi:hypothetical protein